MRFSILFCLFLSVTACQTTVDEAAIKQEILDHGQTIRTAFKQGDLETITATHHPEVIKALGYTDLKNGRDEVVEGIKGTLDYFILEFIENEVEHIFIQDDLAIEQTRFTIRGTAKNGIGEPFLFSGRTMVTYVRYSDSPTGWATIREIIQPATE